MDVTVIESMWILCGSESPVLAIHTYEFSHSKMKLWVYYNLGKVGYFVCPANYWP